MLIALLVAAAVCFVAVPALAALALVAAASVVIVILAALLLFALLVDERAFDVATRLDAWVIGRVIPPPSVADDALTAVALLVALATFVLALRPRSRGGRFVDRVVDRTLHRRAAGRVAAK